MRFKPPHLRCPSWSRQAFTLMEVLITLFLTGLFLSGMNLFITAAHQSYQATQEDQTDRWYHLNLLLERELEAFYYQDHTRSRLMVQPRGQTFQAGTLCVKNQKLIKEPGHQPYAYDIRRLTVTYRQPLVTLTVEFLNGQVFQQSFHLPSPPKEEGTDPL